MDCREEVVEDVITVSSSALWVLSLHLANPEGRFEITCSFRLVSVGDKCSPTGLRGSVLVLVRLLHPGIGSGCGTFNNGEGLMPSGMVAERQQRMQLVIWIFPAGRISWW